MKLRETGVGRLVLRSRLGQRLWAWAHRMYDPLAEAAQNSRAYRRRALRATETLGIRYLPARGGWPALVPYPPDLHLIAHFPDGERLPIHLTEERGYEDLDGMTHLPLYQFFADTIYPTLNGAMEAAIVDCACGSGYGSNYLCATLQRSVIGVDVDEGVIRFARKRYAGRPDLSFAVGDAANLAAIGNDSLLAVISIETIEHVPQPERVLEEFWRVLAPGGALFITSPDATERPGTLVSGYHLREFGQAEFEAFLRRRFDFVEVRRERGYVVGVGRK